MAAPSGGSPSYKTWVSERWIEFDKFKEDTISDIMKIKESLRTWTRGALNRVVQSLTDFSKWPFRRISKCLFSS